jgi:hypothetical protein
MNLEECLLIVEAVTEFRILQLRLCAAVGCLKFREGQVFLGVLLL